MSLYSDVSYADGCYTHGNQKVNVGSRERWISGIAGGVVALYGLRNRSIGGLLLTMLGAGLIHRGVTGHSELYKRFGVNTAKAAFTEEPVARDVHIEKSILIDRSPDEIYRFWRRFENLPQF